MWSWMLIILISFILLVILEETIQFFLQRSLMGPSNLELKARKVTGRAYLFVKSKIVRNTSA